MNHATMPIEEIERVLGAERPYTEDDFLNKAAKDCRNCPNCANPPCPGCAAGGICDESDCYCGDAQFDDPDEAQSSDDLDAEGEVP